MTAKAMIRKEVFYPHPPAAVWIALTDRRALAEWLMPNDFEPELGRKFRFQYDPQMGCGSGITECRVVELEPEKRLAYTWQIVPKPGKRAAPPMLVTWTLTPERGGTRLVLEHTGLDGQAFFTKFTMKMGWGTMMNRWIPKVLGNVRDGGFTPGAIPLEKRCYKCATIPAELTR